MRQIQKTFKTNSAVYFALKIAPDKKKLCGCQWNVEPVDLPDSHRQRRRSLSPTQGDGLQNTSLVSIAYNKLNSCYALIVYTQLQAEYSIL